MILRLSTLFLGVILTASAVSAQLPEPKAVYSSSLFNFGKLQPGAVADTKFTISNSGNAPLEIQKVIASCGCTSADVDKKSIPPGESATLAVRFSSKGFFGEQVKNVRVYTNDPKAHSLLFTLRGEVEREFSIQPAQFFFGNVLKGSSPRIQLHLSAKRPGILLGEVSTRSEFLDVRAVDAGTAEEPAKDIEVIIKPGVSTQILRSSVMIRTNSENESVVSIPVYAKIVGELQAEPSYVSFDLVEEPVLVPLKKTIGLKNIADDSPEIVSIESGSEFISAKPKQLKQGKLWEIEVTLHEKASGIIRTQLTIVTDRLDESKKSVTVPVYAFISRKGE